MASVMLLTVVVSIESDCSSSVAVDNTELSSSLSEGMPVLYFSSISARAFSALTPSATASALLSNRREILSWSKHAFAPR